MSAKMEDAVVLLNREYMKSFCISEEDRVSDLQGIVDYLKDYCLRHGVVFVHGRGKRKSVHQRYFELFRRFLDRQLLYGSAPLTLWRTQQLFQNRCGCHIHEHER